MSKQEKIQKIVDTMKLMYDCWFDNDKDAYAALNQRFYDLLDKFIEGDK